MAKISLPQLNRTLPVDPEKTLMDTLLGHHIPVASSCGGDGICGKCVMKVTAYGLMDPPKDLERQTLLKNQCAPGERLSCQVQVSDSIMAETGYW